MSDAVLGAMWGDEGKGHITHHFSKNYDWIIRFNGGANAGHTIYRDGKKYIHNLLPSFDWRSPRPKAFLGSGMVIDLPQLNLEVHNLCEVDSAFPSRVYVDPDAFVVLEHHKEEDKATNGHIGSTNRGIGPAYKSKIERKGVRVRDVLNGTNVDSWSKRAASLLQEKGVHFQNVLELLPEMRKNDNGLLFEGAQGVLLDINHGIYPYVSCSDATIGGIYASGFAFTKLETVYGVAKCYTTKVGEGPFPTELHGQKADDLREQGKEFGATTGRPRRVGWLDLPALRYACLKGGINKLVLTKFDVLEGRDTVPVCCNYETPKGSIRTPMCPADFFQATPNYMDILGWDDSKNRGEIDRFISEVEYATDVKVSHISCGTSESDILKWLR